MRTLLIALLVVAGTGALAGCEKPIHEATNSNVKHSRITGFQPVPIAQIVGTSTLERPRR
jgi:hypothetical protein